MRFTIFMVFLMAFIVALLGVASHKSSKHFEEVCSQAEGVPVYDGSKMVCIQKVKE